MNIWNVILSAAIICAVVFAVRKAIKRRGRCAGCDGSCAGCRIGDTEEKRCSGKSGTGKSDAGMPKSTAGPDGERAAEKKEKTK